jgi:hypothetical protein
MKKLYCRFALRQTPELIGAGAMLARSQSGDFVESSGKVRFDRWFRSRSGSRGRLMLQ